MIAMKVAEVVMDSASNMPIIVLKDRSGKRSLPVWVGMWEAGVVAVQLDGAGEEQQLPHALVKSIVDELGGRITRVTLEMLPGREYAGRIHVRRGGRTLRLEARASDAIAVALCAKVPIFVSEDALASVSRDRYEGPDWQPDVADMMMEGPETGDTGPYQM